MEEARLRADLDAAAETTAAVLGRGPTPESVRFLAASKAFPATTGLVFSGVGSDDDDHTDYLAPGPLEVEVDLSDDDDDDPSLLDYLRAVPAVVDVGTDLAWEEAKDAAGATKDGISDGAGWVWNHGGEPAWNFLAGDAINSCREDVLSGGCAFNAVTTVPLFKAGKALKYVDDVFDRGDDLRDADKAVDKGDTSALATPGPGKWAKANESMSERARKYQAKITGRTDGSVYEIDGVRFDGYRDGVLLEAKGPGYANFVKDGEFRDFFHGKETLVEQAERQIAAAAGTKIRWSVAEKSAADAMRRFLRENDVTGIDVVWTP